MHPSPSPDPLESLVHRTLRAQPLRRAPQSLETRVRAELARQAALPWWKQSYTHWPSSMRGAFFLLSALAVALLVAGVFFLTRSAVTAELMAHFTGLVIARDVVLTVAHKALVVSRAIPSSWLYGALMLMAASYTLLITAGAAAYRAFLAPR